MKTHVLSTYCDGEMYTTLHPSAEKAWETLRSEYIGSDLDEGASPSEISDYMENNQEEVYYCIWDLEVPEADDTAIWLALGRVESLLKYWQTSHPQELHTRQLEAVLFNTTMPEE